MGALILGCGTAVTSGDWRKLASASGSGAHEIPATPSKNDVDPLLTAVHVGYLVAVTALGTALTVRAQREKLRR